MKNIQKNITKIIIISILAFNIIPFVSTPEMIAQEKINEKSTKIKPMEYPQTKKNNKIDDYFGTKVNDPYHWLEASDAPETKNWVITQNRLTQSYLAQIPKEKIKNRLEKVWNFPKMSAPSKKGNYYVYLKNNGLQNQSVFFIKKSLNGEEQVLLDPNTLAKDGTISVNSWSFSDDGKYFAFALAKGGSDWNEIYVMETETKKILPNKIEWVKFSGIAWHKNGFYYSRYDAPKAGKEYENKNEFHKIFYHQITQNQQDDVLIYEDKTKPLQNFGVSTDEKADALYIYAPEGTGGNKIFYKKLSEVIYDKKNLQNTTNQVFKTIIADTKHENSIIANINGKIILRTNQNAPNFRLVAVSPDNPDEKNWINILKEMALPLSSVDFIGNKFIAVYMKDASHQVEVFNISGKKSSNIKLPSLGTVSGFDGEKEDKTTFFTFNSYLAPPIIFKYDLEKNVSETFYESKIDFKSDEYETKEVFYPSKDGTKVHMFLTHKKNLILNGQNPTYLYGYGGFNISVLPAFDARIVPFLEAGGIYAVANLRGGSEYGENWHKAGMLDKKQNVFDDFIAAAEFLIREKYTSPAKLAISGRSNGGLLVGACMIQRPELFAVALPGVGVLDMLRYHKFTIGWAWVNEYGSSDDKTQFEYIYKYSPLHNIKPTKYPATLVFTADKDDRVVPAHSFKFISTLQENQRETIAPTLIRIDVEAGHGTGKPISKQIDEWTDIWAFILWNLGAM